MKTLLRRLQKLEEEMEREEAATRTYQLFWVNPETGQETKAFCRDGTAMRKHADIRK